jgi:sugar lactone lactonase YvrE
MDSAGNIYIADMRNNRIRKVAASGIITTVAGNGTGGYSGDNGPATSASLSSPLGVALDSSGNIYIADYGNSRIRKVDTTGTITTVAGNGIQRYSGDNGPATSASLYGCTGVALDSSGNIYIADNYNNRIRKVNTVGTIITVAGNGTPGYSGDNGPATSASLDHPSNIAMDSSGNIYIADSYNNRIRKVDTSGIITTVAGSYFKGYAGDNGPATAAWLYYHNGVEVDP